MSYIHIYTKKVDEFNTHAVFISDRQEKRFIAKREQILSEGYELFFDSAISLEHALNYCEEFGIYPDYCVNCGTFVSTALYRGRRFDLHDEKWRVFNGYLCDGCAEDLSLFNVTYIADYKPKLV